MPAAIVLATLMLVMAASSFLRLRETRARRRLITETPTTPAAQVGEGHVEVKGKIVPIELMKSPLGKKDVVYSKWELQEERKLNRINSWASVKTTEKRLAFFLEDESGRIKIVPHKAELLYATDTTTVAMTYEQAPEEIRALLKEADVDEDSLAGHNIRVIETFLEAGDSLYVCGKARRGKDGAPVIDDAESRQVAFLISDHKEEAIVEALQRAERASTWGLITLAVGATAFLLIGLA